MITCAVEGTVLGNLFTLTSVPMQPGQLQYNINSSLGHIVIRRYITSSLHQVPFPVCGTKARDGVMK